MSTYIPPHEVTSPKGKWQNLRVLLDTGVGSWAVVEGTYAGRPHLGLRWNGEEGRRMGHPVAFGKPIWFIVPTELEAAVRQTVATHIVLARKDAT